MCAVAYPAAFKARGNDGAFGSRKSSISVPALPFFVCRKLVIRQRAGYWPVIRAARDGEQIGDAA